MDLFKQYTQQCYEEIERERIDIWAKSTAQKGENTKNIRKFNKLANIIIVIYLLRALRSNFTNGWLDKAVKGLSAFLGIKPSTAKTKLSQLKDYAMTQNIEQVSYGLADAYNRFKSIPLDKLNYLIGNYKILTDKQLLVAFEKLLVDPHYLDDEVYPNECLGFEFDSYPMSSEDQGIILTADELKKLNKKG